jgi:hypothetical protein
LPRVGSFPCDTGICGDAPPRDAPRHPGRSAANSSVSPP